MGITMITTQELEGFVDWEKLSIDIKKNFNITSLSEKDIEEFLNKNEKKYLKLKICKQEIEKIYIDDLTGEDR